MKRTFFDFFKREYEVKLKTGDRNGIPDDQLRGISIGDLTGKENFDFEDKRISGESIALIRDLRPQVMRIGADSPGLSHWLAFCAAEGITPHLVFDAAFEPDRLRVIISGCVSQFGEDHSAGGSRFYELASNLGALSFADDEAPEAAAEELLSRARLLRSLDPDGKIILPGMAPLGPDQGRSEVWNSLLMQRCGDFMDMLGVSLNASAICERSWNENDSGIEADAALAGEIRTALRRLERQIRDNAGEHEIRLAVTGWSFLKDDVPQKRQDCVFYASVFSALCSLSRLVRLNEAGPLFGTDGLLTLENGKVFGNVFYHTLQVLRSDLPELLEVTAEKEKPLPTVHWDGVPGVFEPGSIDLLEAFAATAADRSVLFLCVTNRSPFKRAVARIRFQDISDMHPVKAYLLRSQNRLDSNTSDDPRKVFCKEVSLRNYRKMDHVNLDIPECSTVCMLLE